MASGDEIRLKLVLHYDGSRFFGWQIQPERRTVQGVLQAATARLTGGERTVTGSGRTDRGVHATGQVASLVVPDTWTADGFGRALNAVLPDDVWVRECRRVAPDFHPRFDALERTYAYRLGLKEEASSPFHAPFCWPLDRKVRTDLLQDCARLVPGERSFEAFAKAGQPERGTRCRVEEARWRPWRRLGMIFEIRADRYLHHMVRYLVGTMVDVASARRPLEELRELLRSGPSNDLWTSPPAPARGLYLREVRYPPEEVRYPSEARATAPDRVEAGDRAEAGDPAGTPGSTAAEKRGSISGRGHRESTASPKAPTKET